MQDEDQDQESDSEPNWPYLGSASAKLATLVSSGAKLITVVNVGAKGLALVPVTIGDASTSKSQSNGIVYATPP